METVSFIGDWIQKYTHVVWWFVEKEAAFDPILVPQQTSEMC